MIGKPEAAAAVGQMALPQVPLATIVLFLAYFLLGYFLYAAMFAAVAAMVNTEAEARQAQTTVVMLLVIPTVMMIGILNNPDGSMAPCPSSHARPRSRCRCDGPRLQSPLPR